MQTRDYWPDDHDEDSIQEIPADRASTTDDELDIQDQSPPGFLPAAPNQIDDATTPASFEDPAPVEQSLKDFRNFLFGAEGSWTKGNWTDLFATSLNWMLFDFTFYLLGVNSSRLIPNMFKDQGSQGPYPTLIHNEWHTLVATSVGAVVGGALAIKIMNKFSRKKIQMWCFLALAIFFVILGVLYVTLVDTNGAAVIVAIYVICQFLFNVGQSYPPNQF